MRSERTKTIVLRVALFLGMIALCGSSYIPPVGTANITNGSVTSTKLASGACASNLGSAGGDLSGTYPSPTIANVAVTAGKIASGACASNLGSAGGDLSGSYPSPSIASTVNTAHTWIATQTFGTANAYSVTTGIVAHAGGGQGSCTALTAEYNVLQTVATQLDSGCVPSAATNFHITVYNAGANAACIYPQSGQTIGTMPANACDLIAPGAFRTYFTVSATAVQVEPFYRGNTSAEALVFDDFDTSEISTDVYALGWSRATAGSGANPAVAATSDAGRLGIVLFSTSTSASGASGLWTHSSGVKLGGAYIEIEWSCMFPTLGVTAQQYAAHIGAGDSSTAEFQNGVYFRYSNSANGDVWEAVAANGGTRTRKTTGSIAVAANTWYRLKIAVNPAGTRADYWVNDTYLDNITTNISTGTFASNMANIVKSNGTTASTMNCDWARYYKRFTTAR